MSKYKKVQREIKHLKDTSPDSELYKILNQILKDDDLKEVSGIAKNFFATQTRDYFKKYNRFTDKQRQAIMNTLDVYKDNLNRAGLV